MARAATNTLETDRMRFRRTVARGSERGASAVRSLRSFGPGESFCRKDASAADFFHLQVLVFSGIIPIFAPRFAQL